MGGGGLEITDVRIRPVNGAGRMKAYVSLTFDESFVVHDLRIVEGDGGVFVAMPSKRLKTGEFKDIAHPINTATRQWLEETILQAYAKAKERGA